MRYGRGILLIALLLACGGGAGGLDGTSYSPGLRAEPGPYYGNIILRWSPVTGALSYQLEGREAGGSWEPLHEGLIPGDVTQLNVFFDQSVPELTPLGFRIRVVQSDGIRSDWSEIESHTGIREPASLNVVTGTNPYAFDVYVGPNTLTWQNRSQVATELRLERAQVTGGVVGGYTAIPNVTLSMTSYVDADLTDGVAYAYRLSVGKGGEWSVLVEAWSQFIDIVAPSSLTVARSAAGVQLSWVNPSTRANVEIEKREPGSRFAAVATLPPRATEYLDPADVVWPGTQYVVWTTCDDPPMRLAAPSATLASFTVTGPVTFLATGFSLPSNVNFYYPTLTPSGRLHLAGSLGPLSGGVMIVRDTGAGWDQHQVTDGAYLAAPGVRADGTGQPHAVYYEGYPGKVGSLLQHVWYDGGAWQSEPIASDPMDGASFDVAPDGTLHVLVKRQDAAGIQSTWHVAGSGGASTFTEMKASSLPTLPPGAFGYGLWRASLAVADDGNATVLLVYASYGPTANIFVHVLLERTPAGIWTETRVTSAREDFESRLAGVGRAGAVAVVQTGWDYAAQVYRALFLRRTAGTWEPPEEMPAAVAENPSGFSTAISPDGNRAFVLLRGSGLQLLTWDASDWETMTLGPGATNMVLSSGYFPDGRAHVEIVLGLISVLDAAVFLETPATL